MDFLIVGAGGHGRVVLEIAQAAGAAVGSAPGSSLRCIGFVDANPELVGTTVGGVPVLAGPHQLPRLKSQASHAIVGIGDNISRQAYARRLTELGFTLITLVHPRAVVSPSARLGKNVVVCAGSVVGTEARVADSAIINTSAVVDHECEVGEAAHICPGVALAGRVRVGALATVGTGSSVIPCRQIGASAVIGAGTVVIVDIPAGATAVGVPSRIIRIAGV